MLGYKHTEQAIKKKDKNNKNHTSYALISKPLNSVSRFVRDTVKKLKLI